MSSVASAARDRTRRASERREILDDGNGLSIVRPEGSVESELRAGEECRARFGHRFRPEATLG